MGQGMLPATPSRTVSLGSGAKPTDARAFWQLYAWGAGAALALIIAVVAGRTDLGAQRASAAVAAMLSPPPSPDQQLTEQMTAWSASLDKQMRRQAEIIRALAEQRDSLTDKVGALERQLSEFGGALARTTARLEGETRSAQQAAAAASVAAASATRLAQTRPDPPESPPPAVAALPPQAAPGGRITPAPAAQPAQPTQQAPPAQPGAPLNLLPLGQIPPGQNPPGQIPGPTPFPVTAGPAPTYTGTIPMPAAPEAPPSNGPPGMMRPFPVQTVEAVPQPRPNPAKPWQPAAPPSAQTPPRAPLFQSNPLMTTGIFDTPAEHGANPTESAVDLGAAPTVEALRGRWNDLRASQSPLFDSMKPLIAIKEGRSGQELHLIAGPLVNNAAGARLCAVLSGTGAVCQPTAYEGQRLTAR
jgi:hypothetical protein